MTSTAPPGSGALPANDEYLTLDVSYAAFIDARKVQYALPPFRIKREAEAMLSAIERQGPWTVGLVRLIRRDVEEFGLARGASYSELCSAAQHAGIQLCPPQVGLMLCMRYSESNVGETVRIAMAPILGKIHVVRRDRPYVRLSWDYGAENTHWDPERSFIFRQV
jgi:hypothetical protein